MLEIEHNRQDSHNFCARLQSMLHTQPPALIPIRHGSGQGSAVWNHIHLGYISPYWGVAEWKVGGSSIGPGTEQEQPPGMGERWHKIEAP